MRMNGKATNGSTVSFRQIMTITYPVVFSMFSLNIMILADRAYMAHYDLTQFAAMMPAGFFATAVASLFSGITGYTSVLVAQYYGAGRYQDCSAAMWQGIYIGVAFSLLLLLSAPFLAGIFSFMGHTGDLLRYERHYFFLIIVAGCVQLFSVAISSFYRGIGDTRTTMYVGITANAVNIVLAWLFIFGHGGWPELGIAGAGTATILSCLASLCLYILLLTRKKDRQLYRLLANSSLRVPLLRKLVAFGLAAGIQAFVDTGYFSLLLLIIGKTGEFALTCANIAFTIEGISILPVLGLAAAVGIIAGQERGAGRVNTIAILTRKGVLIGVCFNLLLIMLYNLYPEALIALVVGDQSGAELARINSTAVPLVRLISVWLVFDTVHLIIGSVLQAMGDTLFLMYVYAVVPFVFYIVIPYFVCVAAGLPLFWLWLALAVYSSLMALIVALRFLGGKWQEIQVI